MLQNDKLDFSEPLLVKTTGPSAGRDETPPHVRALFSKLERLLRSFVKVATLTFLLGVCEMLSGMRFRAYRAYRARSNVLDEDGLPIELTRKHHYFEEPSDFLYLAWKFGLVLSCLMLLVVVPFVMRLYQEHEPTRTLMRGCLLKSSFFLSGPIDKSDLRHIQDGVTADWQDLMGTLFGEETPTDQTAA